MPSHPPTQDDIDAWWAHARESPPLCLAYVQAHAERGNPQSVVDAIDAFCQTRRMMNVGAAKGAIVDAQIRQTKPRVMAELGAYAGYSTVRFASLQRDVIGPDSHYYAFEFSPAFAAVVQEMVAFAGLSDHVTINVGAFADNLARLDGLTVDMYFIDHDKSLYLDDAKRILASGTLQKGSVLVADNIIKPGAPDYLAFMQRHPQFQSSMHEVREGDDVDAVLISEFQG